MTGERACERGAAPGERAEPPSERRRSTGVRVAAVAAILAGASLTLWLLTRYGWRSIGTALSHVGAGGLALFCGYTLLVFLLLGWCWFLVAPEMSYRKLPAFVFGRLLREAAADVLPFSQLGGFVLGARGVSLLGLPTAVAVASCGLDMGAEVLGQLMFTATGVAILIGRGPLNLPHALSGRGAWAGLAALVGVAALLAAFRRRGLRLIRRAVSGSPKAVRRHLGNIRGEVRRLVRRPIWFLASVGLHFVAWLMAAAGVWLMWNLFGAPLSLASVIAMEGLIYVLRSLAFIVPGAVGVLEGGYVLLGPAFGLTPEVALSLSLLKRARDLALGLPVVLAWQLLEGRSVMNGPKGVHIRHLRVL